MEALEARTLLAGNVVFLPAGAYPLFPQLPDDETRPVAVGDVDGSGKDSVVVTNTSYDSVSVLLNRGDGQLRPEVSYAVGSSPDALALGDLDGDGNTDIVTANPNSDTVSVLPNRRDGTFLTAMSAPVGSSPDGVAVGDLNGDGKADIATSNRNGGVSVLLSQGGGTFLPPITYAAGTNPSSVAVGDVNGDGKLDIVTGASGFAGVSVYLNAGDGTFPTEQTYAVGPVDIRQHPCEIQVVLADFNTDGTLDIAAADRYNSASAVLLNQGDGTFGQLATYPVGGSHLAVADIDNDGHLDLVVSPPLSVMLNQGDGTFQLASNLGSSPLGVAVGDFNADGQPDLVEAGVSTAPLLINDFRKSNPPVVTITTPEVHVVAQTLSTLTGTATPTAGARIDHVMLAIGRMWGQCWRPGTGWENGFDMFPAHFDAGTGRWDASNVALPSAADLAQGQYTVWVYAYTQAGVQGGTAMTFTVDPAATDATPPVPATFTIPDPHRVATGLPALSGMLGGDPGDTAAVRLLLSRQSDGAYWDPMTGWGPVRSTFPASLNYTTGQWTSVDGDLPVGADLPNGRYTAWAYAFDQTGNRSDSGMSITVDASATDTTRPTPAKFTTPALNTITNEISQLTGTAADDPGGSGLDHVDLLIARADGKYWTGSAATGWSTQRTRFAANLTADGHWSAPTGSLPAGLDLPDGFYMVWAYSYDHSGNRSDSATKVSVFHALGTFPSAPGTYTIDTSTLTMTGPGNTNITGVESGGNAVFTFDTIQIGDGMKIVATGSRPLVLLSYGDVLERGTGVIDVSGQAGVSAPANSNPSVHAGGSGVAGGGRGGSAGSTHIPGSAAGDYVDGEAGFGPGGGHVGSVQLQRLGIYGPGGGGGGFGGAGGISTMGIVGGVAGGPSYGNLAQALLGGSGGGAGSFDGGGGGGGGGAIEVHAAGDIFLEGAGIRASGGNGGSGNSPNEGGGGAGSGGAIKLVAQGALTLGADLHADGGKGGFGGSSGGGGGGGQILLAGDSITLLPGTLASARGGAAGTFLFDGQQSRGGRIQVRPGAGGFINQGTIDTSDGPLL